MACIRNKFVNKIHKSIFSVISLVAIAGLVLGIYGGIDSSISADLGTNDLLKAAVICFAAAYLAFACLFLFFLLRWRQIPTMERQLLRCFAYCAPFMVIRLLYSILPTFVPSLRSQFNSLIGNVTIYLFMAVVEEILIVACYIFIGMRLETLPEELKPPPIGLKRKKKSRT
jgi:hypothetical protein